MPTLNLTHHPQYQASDCLAACAQIAIEHLDFKISYRRLLRLLKVRPNAGTSFLNLSQLEIHYPSLVVTIEREFNDPLGLLERTLQNNSPVIVSVNTIDLHYWHNESTDHAIVVSGISESSVLLYDPWFNVAPQIVEKHKFESAWLRHEFLYGTILKRA